MASKYWIKLYHETLNDPKMIRLSDRLYRRTIELFLLAGDLDEGGDLPTILDLAVYLRTNTETIETELVELAAVGIVSQYDGGWFVTNFAKRQGKMGKAEYMRRLRDDRQKEEYYQPVTNSNADKEEEVDKEVDKETKTPYEELFDSFAAATKMTADGRSKFIMEKWHTTLASWVSKGVTPDMITTAMQRAKNGRKKYTISGPWSLDNFISNLLMEREQSHAALEGYTAG